ncbi:MAG: gluconate 2-dehydrogenase subunit 3 family protein [Gammaproteobacteria bacterium]
MQRRRTFLLAAGGALTLAPPLTRAVPLLLRDDVTATLAALLDTLLPGDDHAPAASALALAPLLVAGAARHAAAIRLLDDGCAWLDATARAAGASGFAALAEAGRIAIVEQAAAAADGSLPRRLFESVHRRAFELYYSDPRSWTALGYGGPPQPLGFPDYAAAPAAR